MSCHLIKQVRARELLGRRLQLTPGPNCRSSVNVVPARLPFVHTILGYLAAAPYTMLPTFCLTLRPATTGFYLAYLGD